MKYKCTQADINNQLAQVTKANGFGAQLDANVLDLSDLNLSLKVPDSDMGSEELIVTLRLTKETEYVS